MYITHPVKQLVKLMASWAKKEFAKLGIYKSNRRLLLPRIDSAPVTSPPVPRVQEVVLAADLGCPRCRKKVIDAISSIKDVESMVVHMVEKKVTLARKSVPESSRRKVPSLLSSTT